jgi:hypothetical protein
VYHWSGSTSRRDKVVDQRSMVYPNPFSSLLTIETGFAGQSLIQINSTNGQLIYTSIMAGNHNQMDLSFLMDGFYFITIKMKDLVTTRKILKR